MNETRKDWKRKLLEIKNIVAEILKIQQEQTIS